MGIKDFFQDKIKYYGGFSGDVYDILRPDYTAVDNDPVIVRSGVTFRCDPTTPQFSEPKFREVDWYEIFCDRKITKPGDILKRTEDDEMTPEVTIAHFMPNKACIGFRTARICNLLTTEDESLYENVYFDFLGTGYPGSAINKKLEKSMRIPSNRVVLYKRNNLIRLRTQLEEIDSTATITKDGVVGPYRRKWLVEEIDYTGNVMVLTISNNLDE
jgi:hypothetical protein